MKKKALISVTSKQNDDNEESIEVVTPGMFYKRNESYYVMYEETEISGMQGTTTTLKTDGKSFTLSRKGTTNTKMTFEKNSRDVVIYGTPHGMLELLIDTKDLKIHVNDDGGSILANYNLALAGQEPLKTVLNVEIQPQDEEWN